MELVTFTEQGRKRFGKTLLDWRKGKGWSLRDAADYINHSVVMEKPFSASALGDIENAVVKEVKTQTLLMLAQVKYGEMTFNEMLEVLTSNRLALCEPRQIYAVSPKDAIA